MNAVDAIKWQELAAYHLAEADRWERKARTERVEAVKYLAACNLFFKEALELATQEKSKA